MYVAVLGNVCWAVLVVDEEVNVGVGGWSLAGGALVFWIASFLPMLLRNVFDRS